MDYDTWKQDCCEELSIEDDGYVHEDDLPDLDECRNAVVDMIAMIYGSEELECSKLDDRIGFLAVEFGLKMPEHNPNVMRPPTEKEISRKRLLQWYVGYTRAHAELTNRR